MSSRSGSGSAYAGRDRKESSTAASRSGYVGFPPVSSHILSASASNFLPHGYASPSTAAAPPVAYGSSIDKDSFLCGGYGGYPQKNDMYDIFNNMSNMGLQGQGHGAKQSALHAKALEFVPGEREHHTFSTLAENF